MINITRTDGPETSMIYYVLKNGNFTDRSEVLAAINSIDEHEVVLTLGYPLVVRAEREFNNASYSIYR